MELIASVWLVGFTSFGAESSANHVAEPR